jgi:hypothetical protein
MAKGPNKSIHEYLAMLGRKGGKARAKKYSKKTLGKWAKLGGRPPRKGKSDGS